VRRAALDWHLPPEVVDDAETVVSELVTNAVLHARTPLELLVTPRDPGLRLELVDGSPDPPLPTPIEPAALQGLLGGDEDSELLLDVFTSRTTGRGLAIVGALADQWGVDPLPTGKKVWAVLGGPAIADADAPPDAARTEAARTEAAPVPSSDDNRNALEERDLNAGLDPREEHDLRRVRLAAVPVRLLLASDDRLAAVTRDLEVALLHSPAQSVRLADVVVTSEVVARFEQVARPRREAGQPALARGDRLADLDLLLPSSAPATLAEIDEVIARTGLGAAQALSVEGRSPELGAFDAWYANEVAAQIAGAPPRPCPFPSAVRRNATAVAPRADWGEALRDLERLLGAGASEASVLRGLLEFTVSALGATTVSACMLAGDGTTIRITAAVGYPEDVTAHWAEFSLSADLPASEAIRTDRPIVIRTVGERRERYPSLEDGPGLTDPTTACIPMTVPGGPPMGCLSLNFPAAREFSVEELAFLRNVANMGARFVVAHRTAAEGERSRQRTLAVQLAATTLRPGGDAVALASAACDAVVPGLIDFAAVHVGGPDGAPVLVAHRHRDPAMQAVLERLHDRWPRPPDSHIGRCIATGRPFVFQVAPEEALATIAHDDEHLGVLRSLEMGSGAIVPVPIAADRLGALSISNSRGRYISHEDLTAATEVARLLGVALGGGVPAPSVPSGPPAGSSIVDAGSLSRVALALTGALTEEEVTASVFRHALRDIGASTVGLWLQASDGHLRLTSGIGQADSPTQIRIIPPDSDLPAAVVLRTGQPVAYASAAERDERWPSLVGQPVPAQGVVTLHLTARGVTRGVLTVGFPERREFTAADLAALQQLADLCASALDRGSLYDAERQGREMLQFLVDAGAILAGSLDADAIPGIVADLAVPRIADWCVVYQPDGPWLRRSALRISGRPELTASLAGSAVRADADVPVGRCFRSGRVEVMEDVQRDVLAASYPGQALNDLWRLSQRQGLVGVVAPIASRGRTIGVLSIGFVRRAPFPRPSLVQAVTELAARVGSALDVAMRFRDERAALQGVAAALLPPVGPDIPGVTVATRYVPATGEVCGDWYEVASLPDGELVVGIGDAAGHGLQAATLMAELRHGARALAIVTRRPHHLLDGLAATLSRRDAFATATYFRIDPASGRAAWASAGHLPPLLLLADGTAAFLPAPTGPPLGTPGGAWGESTVDLHRDETLVLYTDGLVERRPAPIDDGLHRLRLCAEKYSGAAVDALADALLAELDPGRDDDVCVVVLRLEAAR
jgi:GAF domain-containing protein